MAKTHTYSSESIDVIYDVKKCIHAAECVKGLPNVFDPAKKPWIEPAHASAEELAAVIRKCPSGALTYRRLDGAENEHLPETNVAHCDQDGPINVRGNIAISDSTGEPIATGTRFTLCRCGESENKPFCDNAHVKCGFTAEPTLGEGGLKEVDITGSVEELKITPLNNGPLLLNGPMTISAADGSDSRAITKCALCRCGHSKNKPFCDGSHKDAGFIAQ